MLLEEGVCCDQCVSLKLRLQVCIYESKHYSCTAPQNYECFYSINFFLTVKKTLPFTLFLSNGNAIQLMVSSRIYIRICDHKGSGPCRQMWVCS